MKTALLAVLLLGLAPFASATGEGDQEDAVPGLIPAGGIMLFYQSEGPLSFVTMTPKDRPAGARELGTVKGVSCQHGLSIPLAAQLNATSVSGGYGDGSFQKALQNIKKESPDMIGLYDVRADLRVFSILGIYRKLCTEVTARAFAAAP
ncbi:MAG: hypothetical protein HYV14_11060 [Elusimicrobia bacterium]|nr:hypothetical protein [Elusimicrobiota bacterium]